ncbi:ribosome-associated translation inhibitor RaiA [bacterium]|nr:ribosome-associated translation inhibitor RaiA [bacterium]
MNVHVTCRHMELTPSLKNHVEDKVEKLKRYLKDPIDCHVILFVEKIRHSCEITINSPHFSATALECSDNMYASIDSAVHKMERQLKKHKEIVKSHHNKSHDKAQNDEMEAPFF